MIINVDVKKVCGFLGIKTEDFNNLTLNQIEEAQSGIKVKEYKERCGNESLMEDYRFFFKSYNKFVELFGKELTDKYLPLIPLEHLIQKEYVQKGHKFHRKPARLIGEGVHSFPVLRGRGSRSGATFNANADIYMVSSDYQGLKHSEIIKPILKELYPWLEDFKISIYELSSYKTIEEFYVNTELDGKSLYVPYEAFLKGDIESIKERNINYFGERYRTNDSENNYCKELFESLVVQSFFSCMKGN